MAAVEVTLPRLGTTSNISGFSVQEDATPLDPGSSTGGVGMISLSLRDFKDAPLMVGGVVLADGARGKTSGVVRSASGSDGFLDVQADSILGLFNVDRVFEPYVGTLTGAIQYYCNLVGITNDLAVDSDIATRSVVYPGGSGNVWVRIKQIMSAEGVEMSLVFNRIYVRRPRKVVADLNRMSSDEWSIGNDQAYQSVEVNYYNNTAGTNMEVYPVPGQEPSILVVDSGQTQTLSVELNASVTSVNQPVPTFNVPDASAAGTLGVYSVTGNDDLPIQPAQWLAAGGSLSVSRGSSPNILEIVVRGARLPTLAPFRIAMSSGQGNYYNSLRITGTGVAWRKQSIVIPTGAVTNTTSALVGPAVENPYISSLSQAFDRGLRAAGAKSGLQYTRSGNAFSINRSSDSRDVIVATVADFNALYPWQSIVNFNSTWSGQTIAQFNAFWVDRMQDLWENQLFGNAPGARILTQDANFRVENAVTSETSVQFTASLDTTIQDFNAKSPGTVAGFNLLFPNYTCKDFSVVPLRRGQ